MQIKSTMRVLPALAVVLVAAAAVVIVGAHGFRSRSAASTREATPLGPADKAPAQLVRVFVHEFDLYPDLIKIKSGKIFLRAENEKRMDIALIVERASPGQTTQQITRISAARNLKRAGQELILDAGEYVFYEESNPDLRGTIIVEPN